MTRPAGTPFVDAYAVLEVRPDATAEELKAAHRRLVRVHHPDLVAPDRRGEATRRTQDLNVAYGLVRDPTARAKYDRLRVAHLARAAAARRLGQVDRQSAEQWEALVVAAGRWAGLWWRRHRARIGRAGLRARAAGADVVGRVVWLLSVVVSALTVLVLTMAGQRLTGAAGPFALLAGIVGGGWVGARRGWERRLRLAGRTHLLPAARRAVRVAMLLVLVGVTAGLALDAAVSFP